MALKEDTEEEIGLPGNAAEQDEKSDDVPEERRG